MKLTEKFTKITYLILLNTFKNNIKNMSKYNKQVVELITVLNVYYIIMHDK